MLYTILIPIIAMIFGVFVGLALAKFHRSKQSSVQVTDKVLLEREIAVLVKVGVGYFSDFENVESSILDVASQVMKEVTGGVYEYKPFIKFRTFSKFNIDFTIILRAKSFNDQYMVKYEFINRLNKRFNNEGIEILFPIRKIHLKRGG